MIVESDFKNYQKGDFHDGWIDMICGMVALASPEKREHLV